jgi:hypothetical protein
MASNVFKSLSILTALALVGSPLPSDARGITARSGSPVDFNEVSCWGANGPTMTNLNCGGVKAWHIPLVLDGSFNGWYSVTVTATAASFPSDVRCRVMSTDKNGIFTFFPNFFPMPSSGGPADLSLSVWVPGGGTAMLDCLVNQGSSLHTVNF